MGTLKTTLDAIDEHLMLWGFIPKHLLDELRSLDISAELNDENTLSNARSAA